MYHNPEYLDYLKANAVKIIRPEQRKMATAVWSSALRFIRRSSDAIIRLATTRSATIRLALCVT